MSTRRRGRRWPLYLLGSVVVLFGLVAFAHTKAGRPVLNALRGAPGCPIDLASINPGAIEARRMMQLEAARGQEHERSRPALSFELGRASKRDVLARLKQRGVQCSPLWNGAALRCNTAPASLSAPGAPRVEDLHLQFDARELLVAVDVLRTSSTSAVALDWLDALDRQLEVSVGRATAMRGARTTAHLDEPMRRTELEYRYRGYLAQVSATNLGQHRVRVREQYQWLPEPRPET